MGLLPNIFSSSKPSAASPRPASPSGSAVASAAASSATATSAPSASSSSEELSPSFYCPITMELMTDPVIDRDGISYERVAITEWLEKSAESPVTRKPLSISDLVPNRSLKELIAQAVADAAKRGQSLPAMSPSAAPVAAVEVGPVAEFDTPAITVARLVAPHSADSSPPQQEVEVTYSVSIEVPEPTGDRRLPVTVCCVVDTSGSMCSEASVQGVESSGLSMLDIVKHAVRTIITTLDHNDRFALVDFSDAGRVHLELTAMTPAGKELALQKVEVLKPGGMTNLWDGLLKGMEVLERAGDAVGNGGVFLLTDGVPSNDPPRGYIPSMVRYREKLGKDYPGCINTFGFGYSLNSQLLTDIAVEGGGMYSFIPDSGFVGTAFVNSLGNHLSRMGKRAVLSIELQNGARMVSVEGKPEVVESSWGVAVKLPSLFAGAAQEVVFKTIEPVSQQQPPQPNISLSFCYEHLQGVVTNRAIVNSVTRRINDVPAESIFTFQGSQGGAHEGGGDAAVVEYFRARLSSVRMRTVDFLRHAVSTMQANPGRSLPDADFVGTIGALSSEATELMLELEPQIARLSGAARASLRSISDALQGLKADLTGQITEALSKTEWFTKWGRHYLPSLQRAHLLRQSNNFKDPGIQGFGGRLFRQERDKADDVFMSLPPPKPSRAVVAPSAYQNAYSGSGTAAPPAPRAIDMSMYNNVSSGCVHEDSLVMLHDGSVKVAREVRRGDLVRRYVSESSSKSATALGRVECVVKTSCAKGVASLVPLSSGLRITAWHPVRRPVADINSTTSAGGDAEMAWMFPAQCPEARLQSFACDYVYTFVVAPADGNDGANQNIDNGTPAESYVESLVIDGTECITLGHGLRGDAVASHSFLGTHAVIDALRACRGWERGEVNLRPDDFKRDADTGLVYTIKQDSA